MNIIRFYNFGTCMLFILKITEYFFFNNGLTSMEYPTCYFNFMNKKKNIIVRTVQHRFTINSNIRTMSNKRTKITNDNFKQFKIVSVTVYLRLGKSKTCP